MVYRIETKQKLNCSLETAWKFLCDPNNLENISPDNIGFKITSPNIEPMYAGQIITYKIKAVLGIPMTWVSEITQVVDHHFFIDEQKIGPYKLWHHQHRVYEEDGKVIMHDIVHYALPLGILGRFAHWLFVKKQLQGIFDFRKVKLNSLFNS